MSRRESTGNELSEGERLALLEQTVATNRNVLMLMSALCIAMVVVMLSLAAWTMIKPNVVYIDSKTFAELERKVTLQMEKTYRYEQGVGDLKAVLDSSNATAFKALMLEQEQSYQRHLHALKEGMRDLAHMLPGSRTWLDIYNEQIDIALLEVKLRMERLAKLQTNQLPSIDAVALPMPAAPVHIVNE